MAIIYSYPNNINVLATDILICTSTAIVNGKKKNVTRSIDIGSLGTFVNLGNTLNSVLTNGNTSLLSMSVGSVAIDGGLSSEFLKADGSTDSSVYALDADVVHLTGNETIDGIKTFIKDANINSLTIGRGSGNESQNTAIGYEALYLNTTGSANTAKGYQALRYNTTGG